MKPKYQEKNCIHADRYYGQPGLNFLIDCTVLSQSPNTSSMCQLIDNVCKKISADRFKFVLLLSDAKLYMISTGKTLKNLFLRLFHVTCLAHLLHNCAFKIKSRFECVDRVFASVKAATV